MLAPARGMTSEPALRLAAKPGVAPSAATAPPRRPQRAAAATSSTIRWAAARGSAARAIGRPTTR